MLKSYLLLQNAVASSLLHNCSFNAFWYCLTECYVGILVRTSGGGVELSWALAKTLCRQQFRKSRTLYWGLRSQKWGAVAPRAAVRLVLGQGWGQGWSGVPMGHLEGEDPIQVPSVDALGEWAGAVPGSSLFSKCSVVNLGHPSPAAGVSLHQDILWAFVVALGHCPGRDWGGCVAGHQGQWWTAS